MIGKLSFARLDEMVTIEFKVSWETLQTKVLTTDYVIS